MGTRREVKQSQRILNLCSIFKRMVNRNCGSDHIIEVLKLIKVNDNHRVVHIVPVDGRSLGGVWTETGLELRFNMIRPVEEFRDTTGVKLSF